MDRPQKDSPDLKIILLGAIGIGKTVLVSRLLSGKFEVHVSTIGALFQIKRWHDKLFAIWDTAGEGLSNKLIFFPISLERFAPLWSFYARGADVSLFVYDITNRESFSRLDSFYNLVKEKSPNCFPLFIGTKCIPPSVCCLIFR